MSKQEFEDLNEELGAVWEKLMELSSKYPSIMLYYGDHNNRWSESLSAIMESGDTRIAFLRKQLKKASEYMPSIRRKKKKDG